MPSMNKVILLGHLGSDPEVRYTPSGKAVANVNLATSETWKDKDGEKKEETTWHNLTLWGKLGEVIGEYAHKGSLVLVMGSIKTQTWEDNEGQKRHKTYVNVTELKLLDRQEKAKAKDKPQANVPDDDIPF